MRKTQVNPQQYHQITRLISDQRNIWILIDLLYYISTSETYEDSNNLSSIFKFFQILSPFQLIFVPLQSFLHLLLNSSITAIPSYNLDTHHRYKLRTKFSLFARKLIRMLFSEIWGNSHLVADFDAVHYVESKSTSYDCTHHDPYVPPLMRYSRRNHHFPALNFPTDFLGSQTRFRLESRDATEENPNSETAS